MEERRGKLVNCVARYFPALSIIIAFKHFFHNDVGFTFIIQLFFIYIFHESRPTTGVDPLSREMLKKYVTYAKDKINKRLNDMDQDKRARIFAYLRRKSMVIMGVMIWSIGFGS